MWGCTSPSNLLYAIVCRLNKSGRRFQRTRHEMGFFSGCDLRRAIGTGLDQIEAGIQSLDVDCVWRLALRALSSALLHGIEILANLVRTCQRYRGYGT